MKNHLPAPSTGSSQGHSGRNGSFLRGALATRGDSLGLTGRGAPSARRALLGLAAATALLLALFASSAQAAYVQTGTWDIPGSSNTSQVFGIDADSSSGDVFTSLDQPSTQGEIDKWTATGAPGLPPSFGSALTATSRYAGLAVDPTNHRVYALADYSATAVIGIFEPDGTPVGTPFEVATGGNPVGIDVDAAGNVYVPDPSTQSVHEYDTTGALLRTFDPSVGGHGALHDPVDVAVDASGNVYVADRSTNAVNEVQEVDTHEATGGTYNLSFDGATTGATFTGDVHAASGSGDVNYAAGTGDLSLLASGEGDLTKGSATVTALSTTTGTFSVGESISGTGIPLGTTIAALGGGTLTLSVPATASGAATPLTSGSKTITNVPNATSGTGSGTLASGSPTITGVTTATGTFVAGQLIQGTGIPLHATIVSVGPGTLEISAPAESSGAQSLSASSPFEVGMTIQDKGGAAIPNQFTLGPPDSAYATTIIAVSANTLTLSDGVTAAETGTQIAASSITNVITTSEKGAFEVGERIKGSAFGFGGFVPLLITGVGPQTIELAQVADGPATGIGLTAGSATVDDVEVSTGQLSNLARLTGAGLATNRDVRAFNISAHTVTLSGTAFEIPATAAGNDVQFHAAIAPNDPTGEDEALEALPTIGAARRFDVTGGNRGSLGAETNNVEAGLGNGNAVPFVNAMGGRNLPQLTCDGTTLTGGPTPGTCTVTTTTDGSATPGRVVKFDSAATFLSDFVSASGTYTADAIAVDRSTGDVYVAGGNSHWAPIGGQNTPSGPDFTLKRYADTGGAALEEIGHGTLSAANFGNGASGTGIKPPVGPTFALSVNSGDQRIYAVGPTGDGSHNPSGVVRSTVRAFAPGHALTVDATGTGNGSVEADSGAIEGCATGGGGTCADDYADGTSVTLSATQGPLSSFTGWSVDGQLGACPGTGDCTVTIDADTTVHATFTLNQHSLTVVKDGGGTGTVTSTPSGIDCGSTCSESFDEGSGVTLHAQATGASTFVGWSGGGCSGTADCVVTVNADTTVHALFTQPQPLTVTKEGTGAGKVVSTPSGIDCGSTCGPVTFSEGASVTLHASTEASDHSDFSGWSVTGQPSACPGTGDCTVTMNGATTVKATFTHRLQPLTVTKEGTGLLTVTSTPAGISCSPTCGPLDFAEAADVTLHAAPGGVHTTFDGWTVVGQPSACPGTGDCTVTMNAATTVKASSTLRRHDLTVLTAGDGVGTVDADSTVIQGCTSGPPAAGTCTESDVEGTAVALTAHPAAHSSFTGWSVAGQPGACPGTGDCTVSVDADTSVTATFVFKRHSLTVNKTGSGQGSVSCDGLACAPSYPEGSSVSLQAAAAGSTFAGWAGGGCSGAGVCVVTINADTTVSAAFTANPVIQPPTCATVRSLCPASDNGSKGFQKCVKQAKKSFKRALKKAKRKHGKARARALKSARKQKTKKISKCKRRFGRSHGKRHGKRHD